MNLLDRINSGLVLVIGLSFFGCETDNQGLEFDLENNTSLAFEEFKLNTTNLVIDSLRTDSENRVVIGNYNHPQLGDVSSIGYLQYRFSGGTVLNDTLSFDSLVLDLNIQERISLSGQISDEFLLYNVLDQLYDEAVYLADFEVEIETSPLDTLSTQVLEEESLNHTRQFGFGRRLYSELVVTDSTTIDFISALAIGPSMNSTSLISIDVAASDSTKFSIFTSDSEGNSYETRFNFTGVYYSKLSRDRISLEQPINDLDTFDLNTGYTFVNPIFGIHTLVDVSPLLDFVSTKEDILINRAEFSYETFGTDSDVNTVRYFLYKPSNGIRGDGVFTDPINSIVLTNESYAPPFTGSVLISTLDSTSYDADVTLFTEFFYNKFNTDNEFLAERLVISGSRSLDLSETRLISNEISFKIYYTTIN